MFFSVLFLGWIGLAGNPVLNVGVSTEKGIDGKPWFRLQQTQVSEHKLLIQFLDSADGILVEEDLILTPQKTLLSYVSRSKQTGVIYQIDLKGTDLQFTITNGDEKKKNSLQLSKEEASRVAVPPMIASLAQWHWEDMQKKGSFEFLLAVPDRMDTFRFRFVRGEGPFSWVLEPVNFVVRLVAGSIPFVFDEKKNIKVIRGLLPPVKYKTKSGSLEERKTDIQY